MPPSLSSQRRHIQKLLEMLRLQSIVEKRLSAPSFHHAVATNYDRLSEDQFQFDPANQQLTFEYKMPTVLHSSNTTKSSLGLSPLLTVMDDVTSWSALLGDMKRRRFGVSVHLRAEWANTKRTLLKQGQPLQVIAQNTKIGKNLAFIDAKIQDAQTNELLAIGSHIKYLDMGLLLNMALSERGWPLLHSMVTKMDQSPTATQFIQQFLLSDQVAGGNQKEDTTPLFESLRFVDTDDNSNTTKATLTPQSRHASLGGPLHGGCQACLMELVATHQAQKVLDTDSVTLQALQMDYLSTPSGNNVVEIQSDVLSVAPLSIWLQAKILSKGRIVSQGNLRFSANL